MRYIKIATCRDCPHLTHRGGFGKVTYVPVCSATGKTLPHKVDIQAGRMTATYTGEIPPSCPLPEFEVK